MKGFFTYLTLIFDFSPLAQFPHRRSSQHRRCPSLAGHGHGSRSSSPLFWLGFPLIIGDFSTTTSTTYYPKQYTIICRLTTHRHRHHRHKPDILWGPKWIFHLEIEAPLPNTYNIVSSGRRNKCSSIYCQNKALNRLFLVPKIGGRQFSGN